MSYTPLNNLEKVAGQPINTGIGNALANGTIRVVLASDQPAIAVTGGSGSNSSVGLTGTTAPTSATEIGGIDSTGKLQTATIGVFTNAKAVAVQIVDATGNQITSFGSGTVNIKDSAGNNLTSTGNALDINLKTSAITLPVSGTIAVSSVSGTVGVTQSTSPWVVSLASTTITGTVAVTQSTSPWVVSLTSTTITGSVSVTQGTSPWIVQDNADVTAGTTSAPSKILIVGGKTIDGTPQYQPILQGPGGRSVIVEGNASGVAIPVTISGGGGSSIGAITYALPAVSAYLTAPINFSASGDNTIVAGVGGQTVRVFRMFLVAGAPCNLTFKDSTPVSYTGPIPLGKYGSIAFQLEGDPHFVTGSGKAFVINIDAVAQISGKIEYIQA